MVEGVAKRVGHRLCPFLELFPVGGIAGDEVLIYTIRTHGTPLIVVTAQPQLGDAAELVVLGHHLGDEVTVVVDDGELLCVLMVEHLCGFGFQQEILVHECFHCICCFDG